MYIIQLLLIFLLAVASPAAALTFEGNCQLRFFGDSTLHGFEGTGHCQPFSLTGREGAPQLLAASEVTVRVAVLDTDNSSRDETMREMFDSKQFPLIIARFPELDSEALLKTWQGSQGGELAFDLTIRDVIRPVSARVRALTVSEEQLTLTLEFTLSLENFGLEAPGVLGIIRVADSVRVEIDTQLQRISTPAAAAR